MKVKLLKQLVTRLEQQLDSPQAARFNMAHFGIGLSPDRMYLVKNFLADTVPVCKTQACLAGETVLMTGSGHLLPKGGIALGESMFESNWTVEVQAGADLDLNREQRKRLFFFKKWTTMLETGEKPGWPEKFELMYESAKTPQGRLYAAIRRVEHFIKTRGRE